MYIWILLATIMVALSFFNLSPRQDKDHSVNEIKAATVVNRFKAEHIAMSKYMECEIVKEENNSDWDGSASGRHSDSGAVEVSSTQPNLSYTRYSCYLPRGYEPVSSFTVKHYIYCLDGSVEHSGERGYKACDETTYRYLVSFAKIPERWRSQELGEAPVPLFMSFLSKPTSGGSVYGWTDCVDSGACTLRGYSSNGGRHARDENRTQIYEYTLLSPSSILWSEAKSYCRAAPCLFAYMQLPVGDVSNHCYNLMQRTLSEDDEGCDN